MAFSEPRPGLVINYPFLWPDEADSGQDEGIKDRPCAIVLTADDQNGERIVLVVPITHTPPPDRSTALEMPAATKARLGLDRRPSWIITDCLNRFIWPGPDIRPLKSGDIAYGFLPKALTEKVIEQVMENHAKNQHRITGRD